LMRKIIMTTAQTAIVKCEENYYQSI